MTKNSYTDQIFKCLKEETQSALGKSFLRKQSPWPLGLSERKKLLYKSGEMPGRILEYF